jgi:hypothetical protein
MTDNNVWHNVLSMTQQHKIFGHRVEATPLLRTQLSKALTGKINGKNPVGFGKEREQVTPRVRGTARAVDQ